MLPNFNAQGELPEGLYQATMDEVLARFGKGMAQRRAVTNRLRRLYNLIETTGKLERFIIFGSYVTDKPEPNDVDTFAVMAEGFNVDDYTGETRDLFPHATAQDRFGASVFWVSRGTSLTNIDDLITGWQIKRDRTRRGIVEVMA